MTIAEQTFSIMKTILLIAALFGFTALYAQDKNCCCKKKTVKKAVTYKTAKAPAPKPAEWVRSYDLSNKAIEPCFVYRKHNIVVTQCPGTFYDNSDLDNVQAEGTYMGFYPKVQNDGTKVNGPVAPQHNVIDNYKGTAPANGNACTDNCTPQ